MWQLPFYSINSQSTKYVRVLFDHHDHCRHSILIISSKWSGGRRGPWPPGPVKISHKKDGHKRRAHRFHVSHPLTGHWIRYWYQSKTYIKSPLKWLINLISHQSELLSISHHINLIEQKFPFSPQIELNIRKLKQFQFSDLQFNLSLCKLNLTLCKIIFFLLHAENQNRI